MTEKEIAGKCRIAVLLLCTALLLAGCGKTESGETPTEMLNQAAEGCCKIEAFDTSGQCIAVGSGVCLFEEDLVVTCLHTTEGAACINVENDDGEVLVADEIAASDPDHDLVIYRLPEKGFLTKLTAQTQLPERGGTVYTVASFGGITNTVSDGIVGGLWNQNDMDFLLFTAPIAPGCSGGALLNEQGKVLGIICRSYEEGQSMNFAVPVQYAAELYENTDGN